tara:strand:- start:463 stop:633 length:171 start_codon:yes stop_codon:yes gene_type:complete
MSISTTTDLEFMREVLFNTIDQKRVKLSPMIFDVYQEVLRIENPELVDEEEDTTEE